MSEVDERMTAKIATLRDARERAADESRCPHCNRINTMRVDSAERDLVAFAERHFGTPRDPREDSSTHSERTA